MIANNDKAFWDWLKEIRLREDEEGGTTLRVYKTDGTYTEYRSLGEIKNRESKDL